MDYSCILKWWEARPYAAEIVALHSKGRRRTSDEQERYDWLMQKMVAAVGLSYADCVNDSQPRAPGTLEFEGRMTILMQVCRCMPFMSLPYASVTVQCMNAAGGVLSMRLT